MEYQKQKTQKWTVVHSYYAQMGGIQYQYRNDDSNWYCLTASMLTMRYSFYGDIPRHLFDGLILEEQDIKDKSKADWVLKGIAIAQVLWLILSVIVRSILHLPITQLEIATISFAAMAILSYMVNWWKPKDISRPTALPMSTSGFTTGSFENMPETNQPKAYAQSFVSRLWSPTEARNAALKVDDMLLRVPNDLVWMKGEGPLLFVLMAFSSLGFGGLHCLAWNFEFPSEAELLCWRVATVISAALPTIAFAVSLLLHFLATDYIDFRVTSTLLGKLKPMNGLDPDIWGYMKEPHWAQWGLDARFFLARNPTATRDWGEEPSAETIEKYKSSTSKQIYPWNFGNHLVRFSNVWQRARQRSRYAARTLHDEWTRDGNCMQEITQEEVDFWQDYENYVRGEHDIRLPEIPDHGCITFILRAYNETKEEGVRWNEFRGFFNKASFFLTVVNGIIYTVARLTILVLLFTCLRETPAGVYSVTPWVNFLPNIS
ncbi:hypothetical protein CSIM01_05335 [Colletotrichum simmondsii]|uniref:Uncharacterized protein n=1 Tax=Colletotrichum simmondsii TaxID=703756 RepID=A0A135TGY8_9PEZI|nr:hypothetical protein CSIM01_05335 [Colletotrichum simmondsii]